VAAIGIGAALRRIRERMQVSLVSIARRAEISDAMLSRIERGERHSPHFTTVAKIALALGVSLDEIAHEAGIAVAIHRRTTPKAAAMEIRRAEHLDAALRFLDRARERVAKANES
jgi:transcriptional regulator with XRE-family HTH domain